MKKTSQKGLRFLLILIALPITIYTSAYIWIQKRSIMENLSYKPMTEQEAVQKAVTMRTSQATEMQVASGSSEQKINVPAGTDIKLLGVYMTRLNHRSDGYNFNMSPRYFKSSQFFFIELPDGARGAAVLPELEDHWSDYSCLDEDGQTVVYTCPLNGVPVEKQHKVARVPRFLKIPTHQSDGFFMFPRYKSWNMYKIGSFWRGGFMLTVYWLIFLFIVLWRLGAWSIKISIKADNLFLVPENDDVEVYNKIVKYYWPRFYVRAFIAACIFTPLIWLWTRIYTKSVFDCLEKDLKVRCPKCRKLSLKTELTGRKTEEKFAGTKTIAGGSSTRVTGRVWDPNKDAGFFGSGGYRNNTETTYYEDETYDDYVFQQERKLYCPHCGYSKTWWETAHIGKNSRGGGVKEVVQEKWVKK